MHSNEVFLDLNTIVPVCRVLDISAVIPPDLRTYQ